jgi:hypothetical protein
MLIMHYQSFAFLLFIAGLTGLWRQDFTTSQDKQAKGHMQWCVASIAASAATSHHWLTRL